MMFNIFSFESNTSCRCYVWRSLIVTVSFHDIRIFYAQFAVHKMPLIIFLLNVERMNVFHVFLIIIGLIGWIQIYSLKCGSRLDVCILRSSWLHIGCLCRRRFAYFIFGAANTYNLYSKQKEIAWIEKNEQNTALMHDINNFIQFITYG